jgi:hypothetical protein
VKKRDGPSCKRCRGGLIVTAVAQPEDSKALFTHAAVGCSSRSGVTHAVRRKLKNDEIESCRKAFFEMAKGIALDATTISCAAI